jgi:hypothetical protein
MYYIYTISLNIYKIFNKINIKYIPIFDDINNKYLILYIKSKGFVAIIRTGVKYINNINNNSEYEKLINIYCMTDIPKLSFVEIIDYNFFTNFIKIKDLKLNSVNFNKNIFNLTLINNNLLLDTINNIINCPDFLIKKNKKIIKKKINVKINNKNNNKKEIIIDYEYLDKNLTTDIIIKKIPSVWIPCNNFITNFIYKFFNINITNNNLNITNDHFNIINYHFFDCPNCNIYNNNNKQIKLTNNINFNIETDNNIMDRIIIDYLLTRNYKENKDFFLNHNYNNLVLNFIYYENSKSIYHKSIFIF